MLTIGADPEVFVAKNGIFHSAYGLVPGTKEEPFKVNRGAVQVDGVALEFNIDPVTNYNDFQTNLDVVFTILKNMVPDYDILNSATVELPEGFEKTVPAASLEIGCQPDFNAYTEELTNSPDTSSPIRAAGGHIHIGGIFTPEHTDKQRYTRSVRLARLMDKYVGVYSLLWDADDLRRNIYGKAGSFRFKDYGIEYRSLSNSWLFNNKITKFVFNGAVQAVKAMNEDDDVESSVYRDIIDSSDRKHKFFNSVKAHDVRALVA